MDKIRIIYHVVSDLELCIQNNFEIFLTDVETYDLASSMVECREYNNLAEEIFYVQIFYALVQKIGR